MGVLSTLRNADQEEALKEIEKIWQPSIPFKSKGKKGSDSDDEESTKTTTFEYPLDPTNNI